MQEIFKQSCQWKWKFASKRCHSRFSDIQVIALSLTAEKYSIDSESLLFSYLEECKTDFLNRISRRLYNDRRKFTAYLCEQVRRNIAQAIESQSIPTTGFVWNRPNPSWSAISFESKELETRFRSIPKGKETCGNAFLTAGWPVYCMSQLCQTTGRTICPYYQQSQRNDCPTISNFINNKPIGGIKYALV